MDSTKGEYRTLFKSDKSRDKNRQCRYRVGLGFRYNYPGDVRPECVEVNDRVCQRIVILV